MKAPSTTDVRLPVTHPEHTITLRDDDPLVFFAALDGRYYEPDNASSVVEGEDNDPSGEPLAS